MDNVGANIGMGAVGTVVLAVLVALFKCLQNRQLHCISGCCRVDIESDEAKVQPSDNKETSISK